MTEKDLQEEIRRLGIKGYTGTPREDMLLLNWWHEMNHSGDLTKVFFRSCLAIGTFFEVFKRPNWLFYTEQDDSIKVAIWAEPMFSTACVGMWAAPAVRHAPSTFKTMQLVYYTLITIFDSILGITKQEKLLRQHEKLGYNIIGKVEGLFDGDDAWLVHLTRKAFENSKLNPRRH